MKTIYSDFKKNSLYNYQVEIDEKGNKYATFVDKNKSDGAYEFKCNELDDSNILLIANTYSDFFILTENFLYRYYRDWASNKPEFKDKIRQPNLTAEQLSSYMSKMYDIKYFNNSVLFYLKNDKESNLPEFLYSKDKYATKTNIVLLSDSNIQFGVGYTKRGIFYDFNFIDIENGERYTYINISDNILFIHNEVVDYIFNQINYFYENNMDVGLDFNEKNNDLALSYFSQDDLIIEFLSIDNPDVTSKLRIEYDELSLYRRVSYGTKDIYEVGRKLGTKYIDRFESNPQIKFTDLTIINPYRNDLKLSKGYTLCSRDVLIPTKNDTLNDRILDMLERVNADSENLGKYIEKNREDLEVIFNPDRSSIINTIFIKNNKNNKLSMLYYTRKGNTDSIYFMNEIFDYDEYLTNGILQLNYKLSLFEFYIPMGIDYPNKYDLYAIILRVREKNNISYEQTIVQDSGIQISQYIDDYEPHSMRQLVSYNTFINKSGDGVSVFAGFNKVTLNQSYSLNVKVVEIKGFKVANSYYINNEDIEKFYDVDSADVANFRSIYMQGLHILVKSKKILGLKNNYSLIKVFSQEVTIDNEFEGEIVAVVDQFIEWIKADKKITYFIDANKKFRNYSNGRTLLIENNDEHMKFFGLENMNSYDYIGKIEGTNLSYLQY